MNRSDRLVRQLSRQYSTKAGSRNCAVVILVIALVNCFLVIIINLDPDVFDDRQDSMFTRARNGSSGVEQMTSTRSCSELEDTLMGVPESVSKVCNSNNRRNISDETCLNLTCRSLLSATSAQDPIYSRAISFSNDNPANSLNESDFISMTSDCEKFRKSRGFDWKSNRDIEDFPIAFNMIVHTDIEQIERLIYALYRPHNQFCVQSDLKSSEDFQRVLEGIAKCLPNVFLASKLVKIVYSGYSRLQADINCMTDQLTRNRTWKYLINTAGQAFPLRSIKEIVDILRIYNGSNDIEGIYGDRVITSRFVDEWVEKEDSILPVKTGLTNPKPPHDLDIVRGSAYGIFSRGFVEFVEHDPIAKDLLKWSERTWSPDEHFWATLHHTYSNPHLRPPGGYAGNPNQKPWLAVYANWIEPTCKGKLVNHVCVFGVSDLPVIMTRKELFANKFHQTFQPLALECLRSWIEFKEMCPPLEPDYSYYRSLPFIPSNAKKFL